MRTTFAKSIVASGLIAALGANLLAVGPAYAGGGREHGYRYEDSRRHYGPYRWDGREGRRHGHYGPPPRVIVVPEHRHYRDLRVRRDYGHRHRGYGHVRHDHDAYKWLAFTAITVALIGNLTEYQQRAYENAQIRATTAPIGETIHWRSAGAYGAVTATRDGTSSSNRYCREFQKTVTVGGRTEQAYGTACMQPDGAWEVVTDGNY